VQYRLSESASSFPRGSSEESQEGVVVEIT